MKYGVLVGLLALGMAVPAVAQVDVERYIKKNEFTDIKISPDGLYLAATVPFENNSGVAVLRRSDSKVMTSLALPKNNYVAEFFWANKERLLITVEQKLGMLEQPQYTGEIFVLGVEKKTPEALMGYRSGSMQTGTHIPNNNSENVGAIAIEQIPGDERDVLVTVRPYGEGEQSQRAERMDVYTGRRRIVARPPVKGSHFQTDNKGVVRFAVGSDVDNASKLYYRDTDESEWKLVNDEDQSKRVETPLGFAADNRVAYLQVEQERGPGAIVAYDTVSGDRKQVLRDERADPTLIIDQFGVSNAPVGAMYLDGHPHTKFFDPNATESRLYRLLEAAFPGQAVIVTSTTADGQIALVTTYSDTNPGSFYLFDTKTNQASYLLSRRSWIDPKQMATVKPVEMKTRDGLLMRGYLTLPPGKGERNLPLVVFPHGGPIAVYDTWGFDTDAQILAAAGYAVLQVNYRGSGNYGRSFLQAGARQWGLAMQDDLTDATRWAIDQGIADRGRICMYGASYGAYASLMGAAKEPTSIAARLGM